MTNAHPRRLAAFVAVVVVASLVAACTSQSSKTAPSPSSQANAPGNTVGITKSTITVSLIASDLAVLTQQHLAPDIGNAVANATAVVEEINANGGVAGRQVKLITHVLKGLDAVISPEAGRAACTAATEDDKPFAVIITAAISADTTQCVADQHDVLTMTMDSWPQRYFTEAHGRLFAGATQLAIGREREYRAWPRILDGVGALRGKTVGIILTDQPADREAVAGGLKPGLAAVGAKVAAEAVLPCPEGSQTCAQHDAAVQKMKDAKVDFVFLVAQVLPGAAVVSAAKKLEFHPQWATIGQNTTDTVAKFMAPAKDNYEGAWGVSSIFPDDTTDAARCNQIVAKRRGLHYAVGGDAYGFAAVTCLQIQTVTNAIAAVKGGVTQEAVIRRLEALRHAPTNAGPQGSFSPTKHDLGDYVFIAKYDANKQEFVPYDHAKPIKVP